MSQFSERAAPRPSRPMERLRRRVLGPVLSRLGYDLVPVLPEWENRPLSARETARLIEGAQQRLAQDLDACGLDGRIAGGIVREFWDLIPTCPVRQRRGGNGFNGALQVFALVRAHAPAVVIESGVFRGLTTWLIRKAAPAARIFCFDPTPEPLHYRDPQAVYVRDDWTRFDFGGIAFDRALGYFDDHIDQGARILQAAERGLGTLVFDDDADAHRIHCHGGPAHPTVAMLMNEADPAPVSWRHKGRTFTYEPDETIVAAVRAEVAAAHALDDLHATTGYSPSRITHVRLR